MTERIAPPSNLRVEDLEKAALQDKFFEGPLWRGCVDVYSVIHLCLELYFDRFCAKVDLVGTPVASQCAEAEKTGETIRAKVDLGRVNVGIWKLEGIVVQAEHDLGTGYGKIFFSAVLYQLTITGYKEKKRWENELIASW